MTLISHVFPPTLNPYLNPIFPSVSFHISSFQFLNFHSPLKFAHLQAPQWRILEGLIPTGRGCTRAPLPLQPTPPPLEQPPPLAPAPLLSAPPPLQLSLLPSLLQLMSRALPLLLLRAPPLWPLPRGDIIPELAPLRLLHRIPGQPGGPHSLRGPGLQAQGSHPLRDPERHPHRLIRALPEHQTYPLHPSLGGLTSLAAPSRGIFPEKGEISTGRFTTIFRHLP